MRVAMRESSSSKRERRAQASLTQGLRRIGL
jgi:hypothetical protein